MVTVQERCVSTLAVSPGHSHVSSLETCSHVLLQLLNAASTRRAATISSSTVRGAVTIKATANQDGSLIEQVQYMYVHVHVHL